MKLPVPVYRFIEYELLHFEKYKRVYKRMRERLSNSSNKLMIKGTLIYELERKIDAMEYVYNTVNSTTKLVFDELYGNRRTDIHGICADVHISHDTFKKCKHEIIILAARELGLLDVF